MRFALLAALSTLCGCAQLLGFEAASVATDGAPVADSPPDAPPDTPGVSDGPADAPADGFDPASCPAAYTIVVGTSRYRNTASTTPNWDAAADDCGDDGATTHLVVIGDVAEYEQMVEIASGTRKWIGLSDRIEQGNFTPVTDEATTFPPATGAPWGTNEPSGSGCVAITELGTLDATACGQNVTAICECDGIPNDPSNY